MLSYYEGLKRAIREHLADAEREGKAPSQTELAELVGTARGVEYLASHLAFVCETMHHGINRRRLRSLTIEDVIAAPKATVTP